MSLLPQGAGGLRFSGAGRRRKRSRDARAAALFLAPAGAVVVAVFGWPLARTVWVSLHKVDSPMPTAISPFVGLRNFRRTLADPDLWAAAGHTLYFTLASTALELVLGIPLGLLLAQRLRGRWLLRAAVILPWALPTVVSASMWRYLLNADYGPVNAALVQSGLTSSYVSFLGQPALALNMVVLADVWKNTSLVAFFILAGLQLIPAELGEAAEIDGAGAWRRFRSVTLPLLTPVITVVLVLRTIEAFKVFDIVYVMTRGGPANSTQTVALYAYTTAFSNQRFGLGAAIALLVLACVLSLALIYIRLLGRSGGPQAAT